MARIALYRREPPHRQQLGIDLTIARQLMLLEAVRSRPRATIARFEANEAPG